MLESRVLKYFAFGMIVAVHTGGCTEPQAPNISEQESAISVGSLVGTTCTTAQVLGLSKQIAREVECISPAGTLSPFGPGSGVTFTSSAVLPYLSSSARSDLRSAALAGGTIQVNSGYRTVAQQYLLYRWAQLGRCGISIAAPPGTSNHESARAVDLANWSSRVGVMGSHHWSHDVPGDPVHFDHLSSPDIRGRDVRAFQVLWNRNHPTDKISVDGAYGPQTAARLKASPATGFALGPTCSAAIAPVDLTAIEGPERVQGSTQARYDISLTNNSGLDWAADSHVVVASGDPSPLYDAATWASPTDLGPLGITIAAGDTGTFSFDIHTPAITEDTPLGIPLAVVSAGQQVGTFEFAMTVSMTDQPGTSEGDDVNDMPDATADEDGVIHQDVSGGCSAGGSGGWLLVAAPLALVLRRRRRA
jgi:Synergist-CTERM protein sorting domain-containing protein